MGEQAGQLVTPLVMLSKLPFSLTSRFRPLSNDAIEEDAEDNLFDEEEEEAAEEVAPTTAAGAEEDSE